MLYIDTPIRYQVKGLMRGRPFLSSHLMSDEIGEKAVEELLEFGRRIGQKAEWLQHSNNPIYVHFDVMNTRYKVAIESGAIPVTPKEMAELTMLKLAELRRRNQ